MKILLAVIAGCKPAAGSKAHLRLEQQSGGCCGRSRTGRENELSIHNASDDVDNTENSGIAVDNYFLVGVISLTPNRWAMRMLPFDSMTASLISPFPVG